jgi:hypothetical protein
MCENWLDSDCADNVSSARNPSIQFKTNKRSRYLLGHFLFIRNLFETKSAFCYKTQLIAQTEKKGNLAMLCWSTEIVNFPPLTECIQDLRQFFLTLTDARVNLRSMKKVKESQLVLLCI